MGKTAMMAYAISEASGIQVISATAAPGEYGLPFACLHRLLAGWTEKAQEIPKVQRDALLGALALGPPLRPEDRFVVHVAVLSILGVIADAGPVLVVIDDAQWLDEPTAEIFGFVARRLSAEGIAVLLACRGDETPSPFRDLPALHLESVGEAAVAELLADRIPGNLEPELTQRLTAASGGNPLVALEMAAQMSDDQVAGRVPVDELVLAARTGPVRLLSRRLDGITAQVLTAAVLVAVAGDDELALALAAGRDRDIAEQELQDLEDRGVISLSSGSRRFPHPLMRAAIIEAATPRELRAAHRALASAAGGDPERRAWHLAAATLEPDEEIAHLLETVAESASARSGYAAAASAFARAAELSVTDTSRSQRRFAAAHAAWMSRPERRMPPTARANP